MDLLGAFAAHGSVAGDDAGNGAGKRAGGIGDQRLGMRMMAWYHKMHSAKMVAGTKVKRISD